MTDLALKDTTSVVSGFDYSALPADVASEVRTAAERVRVAQVKTISAILDVGRELVAVKQRLGHGSFAKWIAVEFGWSERTAQNYMSAAARFGDKPAVVAVLRPATVYALASRYFPEEVREQVVSGLSSGGLTPEAVGDLVRQARWDAEIARRAGATKRRQTKLPPKQLAKELAEEKRREAEKQRQEVDRLRREIVLDKFVALLRARLGEADMQWLAEVVPDLRYDIQNLARRVVAAQKPDDDDSGGA